MGRHPIENIKQIVDSIFLAIESDDESLATYITVLENFPLDTLSSEEISYLYNAIEEIQKRLEEKKSRVVQALGKKESLKKFRF